MTPQRRGNQIQFVGQRLAASPTARSRASSIRTHRRSGEIDLLSPEAAIADRQYDGANIGKESSESPVQCTGFHALPLEAIAYRICLKR